MPRLGGRALQRAQHAERVRLRDAVLSVADTGLQQAQVALTRAALAATCRPERAAAAIRDAQDIIRKARHLLISYFDQGD